MGYYFPSDSIHRKQYAVNTTLLNTAFLNNGYHEITTSGVVLTLPTPRRGLVNQPAYFANTSTGSVCVKGTFTGGQTAIYIDPGQVTSIVCVPYSTSSFGFVSLGNAVLGGGTAWTPTNTYTTQTPTVTASTTYYNYWMIGNHTAFIAGKITMSDGKGCTVVTIPLPTNLIPAYNGCIVPISARFTVGATPYDAMGYLDCTSATAATRQTLAFRAPHTFTNAVAGTITFAGFFEVAGWTAYTPAEVWTTGTPGSITKVGRYKQIGNLCLVHYYSTSADSNACSALTASLPISSADVNTYFVGSALQLNNATWLNPGCLVDCLNDTEASRLATFPRMTTCIDGDTVSMAASFAYPVAIGSPTAFTPTMTWTQGSPAADPVKTTQLAYCSSGSGLTAFSLYHVTTDGNGCTALVASKIPGGSATTGVVPIQAAQSQNAGAYSNPIAVYDPSAASISFGSLTPLTDAQANILIVGGVLPMG